MELQLAILNTSSTPIYKQLYDQMAFQVIRGELEGGYCLPPIRQLATALGISVISIKRAWEDLERDGFITTNVGRGCFVRELSSEDRAELRLSLAVDQLAESKKVYRALGMTRDEVLALVREHYGE